MYLKVNLINLINLIITDLLFKYCQEREIYMKNTRKYSVLATALLSGLLIGGCDGGSSNGSGSSSGGNVHPDTTAVNELGFSTAGTIPVLAGVGASTTSIYLHNYGNMTFKGIRLTDKTNKLLASSSSFCDTLAPGDECIIAVSSKSTGTQA